MSRDDDDDALCIAVTLKSPFYFNLIFSSTNESAISTAMGDLIEGSTIICSFV